ncbi:MAG TPA: SAM-dependent methyltransferase [Vicinamibacterales bacterium]|nr:SAM-dependent methyltransferase [Vicinamibacterales bacterium]
MIDDLIRERGPITVAAFMELALYHPEFGYYARASQRSGRAGDFFTSVDVGPIFGELLEVQIEEMFRKLTTEPTEHTETTPAAVRSVNSVVAIDFVEAGAGNGRLSTDILRAAKREHPDFYNALHLHLVEASAAARADQRTTLGDVADRLTSSCGALPESFEGVLIANELLDAFPVHQVVMREEGLREVYVTGPKGPALQLAEGAPSTPRLQQYLDAVGARLQPGWRAEINLNAIDWIREAARRMRRGFMILIDYGHEARDLYSASHSAGTLTTFSGHRSADDAWLHKPGEQDITAHVDFTSVRAAAEAEGMETLGFLDQTYFLLGILNRSARLSTSASGALKTLLLPGGLGSTHKVLLLGKHVGRPALLGCSFRVRVT